MDFLNERLNHLMHNETSHSKAFELQQESATFLQSELCSKDEIIKTLLETQAAVLDTISKKRTSNTMGNEENAIVIDNDNKVLSAALPSRSLQTPSKENASLKEHHHQTQKSLSPSKPNNNETEYKNKNNCNQKQLYVGNLNTDVVEEDLNQLFGIRSTKYLQDTCSIKMPVNQKTGKNKGFAFITVPERLYIELIKLNGIEFKGKEITIQDATSMRLQTNVPFKNSKRPKVVVNRYPENQDKFGRRNTVPGQQTNPNVTRTPQKAPQEKATNYNDINYQKYSVSFSLKRNKIFVVGDSHLIRIGKERFKKNVDGANVYFKCFSGANTKQLDYYVVATLADENPDSVIIHIGSNDITTSNYNNVNVAGLAKKIVNIGVTCEAYKVSNIAISSILVRSDPKINQVIKQVNRLLQGLCKTNNFYFICNNATDNTFLWKDGLHLTYEDISKLSDNFLEYLTSF